MILQANLVFVLACLIIRVNVWTGYNDKISRVEEIEIAHV